MLTAELDGVTWCTKLRLPPPWVYLKCYKTPPTAPRCKADLKYLFAEMTN